ncbi:YwmB family TATA-box binding protein [Zhaonella formicivorans]|uniref:YwmB family TATA-box binding protein n=1 Tax=Zhaonella formicivorans TaxID=2528593 RepID=UPI0010DCCE7C|nr:YwmB family TATA-box binding protein [Zhaonella formicivorans]
MQKRLAVLSFLVLITVIYFNPALPALAFVRNGTHPAYQSFMHAGANLEELNVQAWAKLKYPQIEPGKMVEILKAVSAAFDPEAVFKLTAVREHHLQGMILEGDLEPDSFFYANLATLGGGSEQSGTYLLVNLTQRGSSTNLEDWQEKAKAAFKKLGASPKVSVIFTGTLEKELTLVQKERLVYEMFKEVAALRVEGVSGPELVSISGYTPLIKDSLKVDGRKINLNIALSYDDIAGKTVVRVGSPLLNGEY